MYLTRYVFLTFFLLLAENASAVVVRSQTPDEKAEVGFFTMLGDAIVFLFTHIFQIISFVIIIWILIRVMRLAYEVMSTTRMTYMKVTLPRADSKLDKEQETKKDFKEKIGIMALFYKSVHTI